MDLFGIDIVYLAGLALIVFIGLALFFALLGTVAVVIYRRTRRILIPRVTLIILSMLEAPIKNILWIFNVDSEIIDQMAVQIRNNLYRAAYSEVPYSKRAVFLPQCLRDSNCPAPLTEEGIQCIGCQRCGIAEIKREAEDMGYLFFIAPGSTLIKRMVKKYRPKAVLGVGCSMEVKEGTEMMASVGLPVQAITLLRDGCVDTRVNVLDLLGKIRSQQNQMPKSNGELLAQRELDRKISSKWDKKESKPSFKVVEEAKKKYFESEQNLLKK
ncbi:MAG: DUF116 domain-containing protein [Candidatus Altiarchaeota archaeon]